MRYHSGPSFFEFLAALVVFIAMMVGLSFVADYLPYGGAYLLTLGSFIACWPISQWIVNMAAKPSS